VLASALPDSLQSEIELARQPGLRAREVMYPLSIAGFDPLVPNLQAWLALVPESCLNRDLPDSGAQ